MAGLIRHQDSILLVHEQGPTNPAPFWALPGGKAEPGELLHEALIREMREETGLEVLKLGRLLYVTQHLSPIGFDWTADIQSTGVQATAFIFEITDWRGSLRPDDPDTIVLDARFLPMAEAINVLEVAPWRVMTEPLLAYLRNEASPGAVWFYRRQPDETDHLIHTLT